MNREAGIWIIVLVLLLGGGYYLYHMGHAPSQPAQQTPNQTNTGQTTQTSGGNVVDYFCSEGTIVASFTDSAATLSLSDGRTLDLKEGMSGSGIRYENGTTEFVGKGANATLSENGKETYTNCLAGSQTASGSTNTFIDDGKTFQFSYPNAFTLTGGELGYTPTWRTNTQTLGLALAKVTVPRSIQPGTNFAGATFTVGASSDPQAVSGCLTPLNGERAAGTAAFGGRTWTTIIFGDAGAGNFYDTTSYRTVYDGQCYAVEYTIHSTNLGAYPPEQHITAFDRTSVQNSLESMARSFVFLANPS